MSSYQKCGDVIDALIEHFNEEIRNVAAEVMREILIDVTDGNQYTPQDEQTNKILSDTSLCGSARDEPMTPFRTLNEFPRLLSQENLDLDPAISLSFETAEQEGAQRLEGDVSAPIVGPPESSGVELGKIAASNGRLEVGCSFFQDLAKNADVIETGMMSSSEYRDSKNNPQHNKNSILEEELGGISSQERDDALMLEAIMLGGIPEGNGYSLPNDFVQNRASYPQPTPHPPAMSLSAQCLAREQQGDECLKSLQADREKELRALEEAKAALEEEWRSDEELQKKLQEEKCLELERRMAVKEAALPPEPSSEDENDVTLLVKMPDGRRRGRRFLKSDNLQYLFDFIGTSWLVKPGPYRFVSPQRAFSEGEGALTLNEVGLTKKQEVLRLELI
ncbi:hypothetical protein K1719_042863 [Acacia pycnantha]|nr:hypothetical protein K1719_042863 [Acacia pycnantha]